MALPGYRNGYPYLHSHMLAVLPEYRNAGLGRRLKLAQRDDAIARGFDLMEWTYDPLEIKNAHLNIARLGAISRRYQPDFYGPSSSPLQGGLPTDRLYAEWWLNSPRVVNLLQRRASADPSLSNASLSRTPSTSGSRTPSGEVLRRSCKPATARRSSQPSAVALPSSATNVTPTATAIFYSAHGKNRIDSSEIKRAASSKLICNDHRY